MAERRRVELADPNQIGQWASALGTRWRVVAIELDNGALHLERVPSCKSCGRPTGRADDVAACSECW